MIESVIREVLDLPYRMDHIIAEIAAYNDFNHDLRPADYVDFQAITDSKESYAKMTRIMDENNLNKEENTMVFVLATGGHSKTRVLEGMRKFQGKTWYPAVRNFFNLDTFPVGNIPCLCPFLASRIWLYITVEPTLDKFLKTLWAAQINLAEPLLDRQRTWEEGFWDEVATKGGQNFERGRFNRDYWDTKAKEKYPLINKDGTLFGNGIEAYSERDITAWLETRFVSAPAAF